MKTLYANGDSWTHGDEIPDTKNMNCHSNRYYGSWPWLLSRELKIPLCINDGVGGGSNGRIYRRTCAYIINYLAAGYDPKELLIVIGWTTSERSELAVSGCHVRVTPNKVLVRYNISPSEEKTLDEFSKVYYRLLDVDLSQINLVQLMISLRLLCQGHGISYYDFVAIGHTPEQNMVIAKEKFNTVLDNMYPCTWNEYCSVHKESRYPQSHPTAQTHSNWAKLLAGKIKL